MRKMMMALIKSLRLISMKMQLGGFFHTHSHKHTRFSCANIILSNNNSSKIINEHGNGSNIKICGIKVL